MHAAYKTCMRAALKGPFEWKFMQGTKTSSAFIFDSSIDHIFIGHSIFDRSSDTKSEFQKITLIVFSFKFIYSDIKCRK